MLHPRVSIVILQYNNSQDTLRCLASVKELDCPNYNIIMVDNASSLHHLNSTRLFIENEKHLSPTTNPEKASGPRGFTGYQLLTSNYNLGYSGGNNLGIKQAIKNGADYVFILNPDVTVGKSILNKLVEAGESESETGILGPAINEGGRTVYGGKIEWLKPELQHGSVKRTAYSVQNFYISGAAILIKRRVLEKIGLLDERYFLYFEDADYCVRAQRAGYKLKLVPETKVNHIGSASTSSLGTPLLLRYHFRNAHLFNWKNGPIWIKFALPFWSVFIIIKQLVKILVGREQEISKSILAGVVDFYRGRFGQIK